MEIEELGEPINHQAFKAFTVQLDPSLGLRPYPFKVRDEMEEAFSCMFKKGGKIFSVDDKTDVCCMV